MIFLAAGPLVVLAVIFAAAQVVKTGRALDADAQARAAAAAQIVDRGTAARLSGLVLMSNARSLIEPGERERGYELAQNYYRIYGSHVLVADRDSQMLISTRVPLGQPLPRLPVPRGRSAVAETLATGQAAVGDLVQSPFSGTPGVALSAPVMRDGLVAALAITTIESPFYQKRIEVPGTPPAWSVRLLDSVGDVIAATGPPVEPGGSDRVFRAPVGVAPWQMEVHIPPSAYWQPMFDAAWVPLLALLLATVAGLWGGGEAAARLLGAFRALDSEAGAGRAPASGVLELDGLGQRLADTSRVLRDSERSYRLLFELHPHSMWIVDVQSQSFLAVNDAAVRAYGYSRNEFLAMTLSDIRPPEEVARMQDRLAQLKQERVDGLESREPKALGLWKHRLKDGRLIDAKVTSTMIEFDGHSARLVLAVDVTERNALALEREAVQESSQRALAQLRDVLARVGDGFVAVDRDFAVTYANDRAVDLLGLPRHEDIMGQRKADLMPDRNTTPFQLACARALSTQQSEIIETLYEPTGRWLENRIYPSEDGVSVYFTDITERKQTQDALVKSERDFRVLSEQIPAIVYRLQLATGQMDFVSRRIQELGYTPAEWVERPGRLWEAIHHEDLPQVEALVRQALQSQQQVLHLAYRMRDSQGQWHHMDDHAAVIRPDDGQAPFMLGVNVDVTDAHIATEALRRSELQFRRLAEQVPAIIYRSQVGGEGVALYVSPHIASLGYTAEQWTSVQGPNWTSAVHPDDVVRVRTQLRDIGTQSAEMTLEYRLRDAWGRWRHFIDHARAVEGDEGAGIQLQGVMVEITFLKLTEQALLQAEADQRSLFEAMADGVLVLDAEHHVIDANASAATLLGFPRSWLLRLNLPELLPEKDRPGAPGLIAELLATSESRLVQWQQRRRDGSGFPAEVSVRPAGGGRYVLVFRDVTDRLAAEQARSRYQHDLSNLTHRLMSQERETSRHLAQTLHDHLGQSLAVSRLRLDAVTVSHGHLMTDTLKSEWARTGQSLDQAIADVRLVLGDLRPPMLEEQGLLAALDNEVRVRGLDGPRLDVLLELDDELIGTRWPADVEYSAFMVVREALVNVQLHAGASLVRVVVAGDARHLQLQVLDDGRGIADDMRQGRPGHLGLVGMRERAVAIGAEFSVERVPEGGTRVWLQWQEAVG
jgi:PAS domain S-box-containing protein